MRVTGSQPGECNYIVPFSTGALTPKHVEQIGPAFPLFLFYEDAVTTGEGTDGLVLGGTPLPDKKAAKKLGLHRKTAARHRERLENYGYVSAEATGRGYIIRVKRSKKWLWIQHALDKSAPSDGAKMSRSGQKRSIRVDTNAPSGSSLPIYDESETDQGLYRDLHSWWNANRGSLPRIREFTDDRKDALRVRLKKNPQFIQDLKSAVERLKQSHFASEEWKPGIDWFLKNDKNINKALEGNYDNRGGRHAATTSRKPNGSEEPDAGKYLKSDGKPIGRRADEAVDRTNR